MKITNDVEKLKYFEKVVIKRTFTLDYVEKVFEVKLPRFGVSTLVWSTSLN